MYGSVRQNYICLQYNNDPRSDPGELVDGGFDSSTRRTFVLTFEEKPITRRDFPQKDANEIITRRNMSSSEKCFNDYSVK